MSITVEKAKTKEQLELVFKIRREVFVLEQGVDPSDESDEFEESSNQFLALLNESPAGAARWRVTKNGIKLERFAVLNGIRGQGVGQALVKAVLEDIAKIEENKGKLIYLHSQLPAISLYLKFGFEKIGEMFEECNIKHYQMERYL
ncbi:putative acyltransferase [Belliella baltica DSM 15883]|uniref:Putative acyltransferase n=1 Tax=Belliella baltica (strain DSM 15883 / CIP 108006 / LMG 21964 / BA134) TaxID=866536 RepID=I3Z1C8_BELBD|nr:GNAT family N-acetyltransferase [Belliella baltica]AFL83046.1 putative acyltransferase [Belliella baltica DSM 15883]